MSGSSPRMRDFEDAATGRVNWDAYQAAEVRVGRKCYRCNAYTSLFQTDVGYRRLCSSCEKAEKSPGEELRHERLVRCPGCRHLWRLEEYDVRDETEDVNCPECDRGFEVGLEVSVTFVSPPAEVGESAEGEAAEEDGEPEHDDESEYTGEPS
jgi:uncharacterized CHY-type Zn-finger protein